MNNIAIIFDMDGVVVDNHRYHLQSWLQFFEKYGVSMNEQEYKAQVNGRTMEEVLPKVLNRKMTKEEIRQLGGEKEREIYAADIHPVDGLTKFLEELEDRRTPHAIATSAPPANVDFTMDKTGLRRFFSIIVDDTMVSKGKPDPEVYLTAAKKLDMPPERCVVFEDAILGIQAGKNAGMKVIGLATTHTREELEAENTDYIIDDFVGLSLEKIFSQLNM